MHRQGEHGQQLVAVDHVALVVDREAPVGVAVEGEADVRTVLEDGTLERAEVGRAAAVVDVQAVGHRVDRADVGAGADQGTGTGLVRGTLGAVEDDLDAHQRVVDGVDEVTDVVVDGLVVRRDPAHGAALGTLPGLAHPRLDRDLDGVVELLATAGEELDAVVGHRVVRRRQHHAEVGAEPLGQEGDPGGRQDPEQQHVDAGRGQPRDHRGLEELPRDPGVAADHREGSVALELTGVGEDVGRGNGKVQGQLSGEITVGQTPDPVRAEVALRHQRRPRISAC